MATKIIKAWIDGAIQEIEVEDIVFDPIEPSLDERVAYLEENEITTDERLDILEDKPIITEGNFLVGDGTTDMIEVTPDEVLARINGANVVTMTQAEFDAMPDEDSNANTFYNISDAEPDYYTKVETDEKVNVLREEIGQIEDITSEEILALFN